ncbi:hypothetical protein A2U01_0021357 [Trifolium medium]|uniref:Secreted protein n=1 Tax=Trifolium medium TaxID=97028 RepID=A0A392NMI8_9FABA|nr:hypothetical protein [Trifolium medium]
MLFSYYVCAMLANFCHGGTVADYGGGCFYNRRGQFVKYGGAVAFYGGWCFMVPEFNRILSRLFRVHLSFSDGRFALHYCSGNGVHESL